MKTVQINLVCFQEVNEKPISIGFAASLEAAAYNILVFLDQAVDPGFS
jgi:hypothetical protein